MIRLKTLKNHEEIRIIKNGTAKTLSGKPSNTKNV